MIKMITILAVLLTAAHVRAGELLAIVLKAPWPNEGSVLHLVNTSSEDVPFTGILIEGYPQEKGGEILKNPTMAEHLELGPGRKVPANGVSAGIALKRITLASFDGRLDVSLQVGGKRVKISRVVMEKDE